MTKTEKKKLEEVLHEMCVKYCDKKTEAWILTQDFEEGLDFLHKEHCSNCPLKQFVEKGK